MLCMLQQHFLYRQAVADFLQLLQQHDFLIAVGCKISLHIQNIGRTAAHAGSKIASCTSQNNYRTTGHIFTTMVTNTLNNSVHATVTDAEAFTGSTADIRFTACCTIEGNFADNNIFVRIKAYIAVRIDNQLASGKSFADMVIGIALQLQRNTFRQKGAKALAGTALEVQADGVGRQPSAP